MKTLLPIPSYADTVRIQTARYRKCYPHAIWYIIQTSIVVEFGKPTYIPRCTFTQTKILASIIYGWDISLLKLSNKKVFWKDQISRQNSSDKIFFNFRFSFGTFTPFSRTFKSEPNRNICSYSQSAEKQTSQKSSLNSFVCENALIMKYIDVLTYTLFDWNSFMSRYARMYFKHFYLTFHNIQYKVLG